MKIKILSKNLQLTFLLLLIFTATQVTFSQTSKPFSINESPLPAPKGYVNDYANVIDAVTKQRIEQQITEFRKTSNPPVEIGVAVVRTTDDRPIFDYSLAVARGWGIGTKDDDNPSALLFVAIDDRKYFTQVSGDLEDELPDGLVGSLQRQYLVPEFKKGNYGKGIENTVDAYIRTVKQKQSGEYVPQEEEQTRDTFNDRSSDGSIGNTLLCLIFLFFILFIIFSRGGGGGNNRRGGGGSGMGNALLWAVLSGISSGSGGSSSSSGGWSGGGGSSGGWGGFGGGGGGFGGGGAGGSW